MTIILKECVKNEVHEDQIKNKNFLAEFLLKPNKSIFRNNVFIFKNQKPMKCARNFIVCGLLFGARGTLYRHTVEILKCCSVEKNNFNYIAESIIADSVGIIHHHIYNNYTKFSGTTILMSTNRCAFVNL